MLSGLSHLACWILGGALCLTGVGLLVWALIGDRARHLRRCPGSLRRSCWYDLSAVPGLTCPECGRRARDERELHRSRRRRGPGLTGVGLLALGCGLALKPTYDRGVWHAWLPDRVLLLLAPHVGSEWVMREIWLRWDPQESEHGIRWRTQSPERHAAWPDVVRTCFEVASNPDLPSEVRRIALSLMLDSNPTGRALPKLPTTWLADPDPNWSYGFAWGVKTSRFRLGDQRQEVLQALRARVPDGSPTDECVRWAISNIERDEPLTQEELDGPPPGPDEFAKEAEGAPIRTLAKLYLRLGEYPKAFTTSWYGDPSPFSCRVISLKFVPDGPEWKAVVVRPFAGGPTNRLAFLLWVSEHGGYRYVRSFEVINQTTAGATEFGLRSGAGGRQWLTVSHPFTADGPRGLFVWEGQQWLRVTPEGEVAIASIPLRGFRLGGGALGWRLSSTPIAQGQEDGREVVSVDYTLEVVPRWSPSWPVPDGLKEVSPDALGVVKGLARWVVDERGRLIFDRAGSTFPWEWIDDAPPKDADDLASRIRDQLIDAAGRSTEPWMRRWFGKFAGEVRDADLGDQIRARVPKD